MDIFKFSFLLIICDDAQEWGRKSISELYVNKSNKYSFGSIDLDLQGDVSNSCLFRDNQELNDTSQLKILLRNFYKQSEPGLEYSAFLCEDKQDDNFNFGELLKPLEMKDYTAVDFRERDGEELPDVLPSPCYKARDVTLYIAVYASTLVEYNTRRAALMEVIRAGWVNLKAKLSALPRNSFQPAVGGGA